MKTQTIKKEPIITKNGWMPIFIIAGGLVIFIIVLKLIFALLGQSAR